MGEKITITLKGDKVTYIHIYERVPIDIAKAVKILLDECEYSASAIVSREVVDYEN